MMASVTLRGRPTRLHRRAATSAAELLETESTNWMCDDELRRGELNDVMARSQVSQAGCLRRAGVTPQRSRQGSQRFLRRDSRERRRRGRP